MKKILVLGLLIGTSAFAGGVSGGGGNTMPAHPVTADSTRLAIMEARRYVAYYLNNLEWTRSQGDRWKGHETLLTKLFSGRGSLGHVISQPIRIEENGPCLDPAGHAVDGSANQSPADVCLSLPRLTEKLSQENLRTQVVALAVHEYSHLVGSTEAEADFLQQQAVADFPVADFAQADRNYAQGKDDLFFFSLFAQGEWDGAETRPDFWAANFRNLDVLLKEVFHGLVNPPRSRGFMTWSERMRGNLYLDAKRLELLRDASCELAGAEGHAECTRRLNEIFQDDAEIDYHTYMLRRGYKQFPERPGVRFRRVRGVEDLRVESLRLKPQVDEYLNYFEALRGY